METERRETTKKKAQLSAFPRGSKVVLSGITDGFKLKTKKVYELIDLAKTARDCFKFKLIPFRKEGACLPGILMMLSLLESGTSASANTLYVGQHSVYLLV